MDKFPIIKAGHVFNPFPKKNLKNINLVLNEIEIIYPTRLDAMAINPAAVCYNSNMVFTPGEVVVSLNKFINVKVKLLEEGGGRLIISKNTKRKVLVKHSYLLICNALNVNPSLEISVDDKDIPKHCGFGSSSSTITAVATAINELYGKPISDAELIKYVASNHAEEVRDDDENNLKVVQSIGGGATSGLTDEGIIIITGKATAIAKMFYEGKVLICTPKDYVQKDAKLLMELEEKNLWKFKKTGELYAEKIAYNFLHLALPDMANNKIKGLSDVVFDYRFNMGSNENCSFVYDGLTRIGENLRCLYENGYCEMLALSSVGPAYFAVVKNEKQEKACLEKMNDLNLNVINACICNTKYKVLNKKYYTHCFWQLKDTAKEFENRPPSKYITDLLNTFDLKNSNCIDIGAGGGRYSIFLKNKGANVLAVDKYKEMIGNVNAKKINFITACMTDIPVNDNSYDYALSVGVIHNAETVGEYLSALKEIYRILVNGGKCVLSTFTDDVIDDDLVELGNGEYEVKNKPPMVLLSKEKILNFIKTAGFKNIINVDEHITNVQTGKRNVYTVCFEK